MKDYYNVLYSKEVGFGKRLTKLSTEENIDWIRNYFFNPKFSPDAIDKKAFLNAVRDFCMWHIELNKIDAIKKVVVIFNSFESLKKDECQILEDSIKAKKQFVNEDSTLKDNLFEIWKDVKEFTTEDESIIEFNTLLAGDMPDLV